MSEESESVVTSHRILVSNLNPSASEKHLSDFFSFCGELKSLTVSQDPKTPETNCATVEFADVSAVQTALLLTNATIVDRPIKVTVVGDAEAVEAFEPAADAPTKTSVMARLFAAGYILGDDVKHKARSLDEKHNMRMKLKVAGELTKLKLQELDNNLHISETAGKVSAVAKEKYNEVDNKYKITEKAEAAKTKAVETAHIVGAVAMSNPIIAGGVELFQQAQAHLSEKVKELKAQTNAAIDEKRNKSPYPAPANPVPALTDSAAPSVQTPAPAAPVAAAAPVAPVAPAAEEAPTQ